MIYRYLGLCQCTVSSSDFKSERNGILGSVVIHALLVVAFLYIESRPEVTEQLGYIQVEFGDFSEGRPVQSAPVTTPDPVPPVEDPELEEQPPEPVDPEDSKPVDLPDVEPLTDEPEIESPDTEVEAIQPEEIEEEPPVEEEPEEAAPIRPLGSGATDGDAGAEDGDEGESDEEEKAAPFDIEGLDRIPVNTPLPVYASQVNADISVKIWVGPDGRVKRQLVLRKGDPRLEDGPDRRCLGRGRRIAAGHHRNRAHDRIHCGGVCLGHDLGICPQRLF